MPDSHEKYQQCKSMLNELKNEETEIAGWSMRPVSD